MDIDNIRFDGAAFVVAYKYELGELYVLVQDSLGTNPRYPDQEVQTKHPGGKNRDHLEDIDLEDTAIREFEEETGLTFERGEGKKIYDVITGLHRKVAYLVDRDSLVGKMRTEIMYGKFTTIWAPRWEKADQFLLRLLYRTHRPIFKAAMNELSKKYSGLVV